MSERLQEEIETGAEEEEEEVFDPKVRWVIPNVVDQMTFVGREVVAVAHDVYIMFLNLRTGAELVYCANTPERGDGVDVVTGHRTNIFAFAEKVKHARIFIVTFPAFQIMLELKDKDVNRYKGLCFMEGELIAGISGFPDYLVTVWSWRLNQRLIVLPTGVVRRKQLFVPSRSHMLVCQSYQQGLIVWEAAPCYRSCYLMRREKKEAAEWETNDPPLVSICWTNDGQLYACDAAGKLFAVACEGSKMVSIEEWSCADMAGESAPCVCAFGSGILVCCPDNKFRWLKKMVEQKKADVRKSVKAETKSKKDKSKHEDQGPQTTRSKWRVAWTESVGGVGGAGGAGGDAVVRAVSSAGGEVACCVTRAGRYLRLTAPADELHEPEMRLITYKMRNIVKIKLIAPDHEYLVALNDINELCIYELQTAQLVLRRFIAGTETSFTTSPVEPLVVVFGANGTNYGAALLAWRPPDGGGGGGGGGGGAALTETAHACLTHQCVERAAFSPTGRHLLLIAMSAGHIFLYHVSPAPQYKLALTRYAEVGRGLADCSFTRVGASMRAFALVLYSDKYLIGERILCFNAETGKDNKLSGKMKGPYCKLIAIGTKDTLLAVPHLSRDFHILKLTGESGVNVTVKMGPIVDSGHALRQFSCVRGGGALLTVGAEGWGIVHPSDGAADYECKLVLSHRYGSGIKCAALHCRTAAVAHVGHGGTLGVTAVRRRVRADRERAEVRYPRVLRRHLDPDAPTLRIFNADEKTYLELQEERLVREEAMDYKSQRDDVVRRFKVLQRQLVALLEENIAEVPLHQLSLAEFNLHMEHKKERLKQAEREREMVRLKTEARIRAQDKVTNWIKKTCWDSVLTPRVKIYAIFSHYQVENFPVLPSQREVWPELQQVAQLRQLEMENDADLFRPWEEEAPPSTAPSAAHAAYAQPDTVSLAHVDDSRSPPEVAESEQSQVGDPYVLAGTHTHKYVPVPPYMISQLLAFSFLQMNMLHQIVKYNVQNIRLWFNKKFDELMATKKRECGLVMERNTRLRFILEELNKLSDLRGSFHHIIIQIKDPEWRQEEQPIRFTKVEVHECSIAPWKSHESLPPPELKPKDDFRERALNDMMDGVLEKLWHEEIKKPIPKPQCMLDKDPENFNEDDLKLVFDYEAKVRFRETEREKYRHMLHAEYAKLAQLLNEGIVRFNMKVKDLWLLKLRADSVIGQENLNLMRLRRANLDRVESAEGLEALRETIATYESEAGVLGAELADIQQQAAECQAAYDALAARDRHMDRGLKNSFADCPSLILDQCYKYFKKRPKWHQRASMIPVVLNELAIAVATGNRPPLLHPDCVDFFKGVEQLDLISNMPAVMDENMWTTLCRLRRAKIDNEIRMRALVLEVGVINQTVASWSRALQARRVFLQQGASRVAAHREQEHAANINKTIQLVLPAGQVEVPTTGHIEDFEDAVLIPNGEVEQINQLILKVGEIKLALLRKQIAFRKAILAKEWEHAQMKMKLRHMQQELYHYGRMKIVKELQVFLKNKEAGFTDEDDMQKLEKEMASTKRMIERVLQDSATLAEELQMKVNRTELLTQSLEKMIEKLRVVVSERMLHEDRLEPIRIRRVFQKRMETLVARSALVREVQANHSRVVMLQTELELLRLKTYPTLADFRTFC